MKYISCDWVGRESESSLGTEANSPYLVNQRIVNSVNILFI